MAPKDVIPHIVDDPPLDAFIAHSVSSVVFQAAWRGTECRLSRTWLDLEEVFNSAQHTQPTASAPMA